MDRILRADAKRFSAGPGMVQQVQYESKIDCAKTFNWPHFGTAVLSGIRDAPK
jgi:hypothetical protein